MIFGKICYVTCAINRAGQLICLHARLHECDLIDKPALKSKGQYHDNFIMGAIIH